MRPLTSVWSAIAGAVAGLFISGTALADHLPGRIDGWVGFIGDSITYGVGASEPSRQGTGSLAATDAVGWVKRQLASPAGIGPLGRVGVLNQGIAGATSQEWTGPDIGSHFAVGGGQPSVFDDAKCCVAIMVMLGTNDSRDVIAFSSAQYRQNLETLIAHLKHDLPGAKIILNAPIWYDGARAATAIGNGYSATSVDRLTGYTAVLRQLADGKTVFLGDTDGYRQFKASGSATLFGPDGVHPNDAGYKLLGQLWFAALARVLHLSGSPPG